MTNNNDNNGRRKRVKIFIYATIFMVGVSSGFLADSITDNSSSYDPVPEEEPLIFAAYNTTNGEYVMEIGRLDKGYSVCIQDTSFKKAGSEDVFGAFQCNHFPDKVHPAVQSARDLKNQENSTTRDISYE